MKKALAVPITSLLVIFALFAASGCTRSSGGSVPPQQGQATSQQTAAAGKSTPASNKPDTTPKKTMRAFRSERELKAYFHEIAEKQKQAQKARASFYDSAGLAAPSVASSSNGALAEAAKDESVTNVQHAGVDEGGIVKVHGNHLVMLRRGRLFTVAIGDGALTPVSSVDAFGPDIDPRSTWYDEMLVSQDIIAVIGYSYERGGTEVGLFQIDADGKLTYRSTYHLRSNDYYSSRNYASRLIGSKLIFYTPLYLNPYSDDPFQDFPAVRKWHKGAKASEFHRIALATDVYRPEHSFNSPYGMALHTVTTCDLSRGEFDCKATSVLGPPGDVFYVSPESVYVWVSDWISENQKPRTESLLYRMPLDGSAPSALRVSGSPVDQFSFLEDPDGYINVLVESGSYGDSMWNAEFAAGDVALMRVPLKSFSDGAALIPLSSYRKLPKPENDSFQNRFVGDYLLYGAGSGWGYPQTAKHSTLFAVPWAGGKLHRLSLTHGTDRIEQMGSDAVVVGTDGRDLHFTAIRLGSSPEVADDYVQKGASQGELRSHGFFYKPDGSDTGMLGLPISLPGRPGYRHLFEDSAAILFLRNDSLHFQELGKLVAKPASAKDDHCRASCVDWYGNARPLFVRGRIIALLGYELVEGSLENSQIQETRRVSYAPQNLTASRQ